MPKSENRNNLNVAGRSIESTFNVALGEAIRRSTRRWQASSTENIVVESTNVFLGESNSAKRPDILIRDLEIPPVVIECSYSGQDADSDAIARLGLRPVDSLLDIKTAFAVLIPSKYRSMDLNLSIDSLLSYEDQLQYCIHQSVRNGSKSEPDSHSNRRFPELGFIHGSVADLTSLLLGSAAPKEEYEAIARSVASHLRNAALALQKGMTPHALSQLTDVVFQRSPLTALLTSMVLWLNAFLTQNRLAANAVAEVPSLSYEQTALPVEQVLEEWRKIIETNWRSIFEPATKVLEVIAAAAPNLVALALREVVTCVRTLEEARIGLQVNVGAELLPQLSEDRKEAAAFYTQPASAELIARLTVTKESLSETSWQDAELMKHRVLADFACGTGALLRAGFKSICDLHERALLSEYDERCLHVDALESGLVGTDVSPIASHLTATSLAVLGHGVPYSETRIGWLEVGGETAATGSLEFFEREYVEDLMNSVSGESRSRGSGQSQKPIAVTNSSVDWVLMNPPYSRTRGGQSAFDIAGLSDDERRACQDRWAKLIRAEPVNKVAGMAASFLALARKKVKPGGRIGFVLPLTAAFAESWRNTRAMVEQEFEDIVVIATASGKAIGRRAVSADTHMEEMLLVATKRSSKLSESVVPSAIHPVTCVTLHDPVLRCGEATEIARSIFKAIKSASQSGSRTFPVRIGNSQIGGVYSYRGSKIGNPWSPLGVINSDLAYAADRLAEGYLEFIDDRERLSIQMRSLDELFKVGPTHHLIGHLIGNEPIGAFEFYDLTGRDAVYGRDRSLWHASAARQSSLVVEPTHKGFLHPTSDKSSVDRMRSKRSTSFYARNMSWTSQALLVATTELRVHGGSSWTTLDNREGRYANILALWMNSTFGFIVHWTQGQRTHTGRARTQIEALKNIPCPDFTPLGDEQLDAAKEAFKQIEKKKLLPACQAHADPVRKEIDDFVCHILGLSERAQKTLARMRRAWCEEPSVHGWNKKALDVLNRSNGSLGG